MNLLSQEGVGVHPKRADVHQSTQDSERFCAGVSFDGEILKSNVPSCEFNGWKNVNSCQQLSTILNIFSTFSTFVESCLLPFLWTVKVLIVFVLEF